jgi:hypothetical protein
VKRDQYEYSAETLFKFVDCIWDADFLDSRASPDQEVKSKRDPGIQSDLPVFVADIRRAWARSGLDSTERQIFICRNLYSLSLESIGAFYDITEQQVADVLDATTALLLATLNGGQHG